MTGGGVDVVIQWATEAGYLVPQRNAKALGAISAPVNRSTLKTSRRSDR